MVCLKLFRTLGRGFESLPRSPTRNEVVVEVPVDLNLISAAAHHGCMRLPQELVEHIMEMLHDDFRTLKACSLTCKSMFASTRHLIHRTLRLNSRNNQSVLTPEEQLRYLRWGYHDIELRFLSYMGERGFLKYVREVHIHMGRTLFTPDILIPHLDHFQTLDRVHSLTIEFYDGVVWLNHHRSSFIHFYPTLTSLTLHCPLNNYRCVLQFALQFPNLDNLCIEHLDHVSWIRPGLTAPATVSKSPPLRGHLRLVGSGIMVHWLTEFACELPTGINFRSVELHGVFWSQAQETLTACADTLDSLTIIPMTGNTLLEDLIYTENTALRRLTLRMPFPQLAGLLLYFSLVGLSTITSPVFSEFVFEFSKLPSQFSLSSCGHWGAWDHIDKFFEERFAKRGHFSLIIRTGKLYDRETFQAHARQRFPSLAARGCLQFETSYSVDEYWR